MGAANSAGQAALSLADHAAAVTMLVRGDSLERKMSRYLIDRIEAHDRITVLTETNVSEARGGGWLEEVVTEGPAGETKILADGLFLLIGAAPLTAVISDWLNLDDHGYVLAGPDLLQIQEGSRWPLERGPLYLETSQPGVFVAGDLRHGSIKRVGVRRRRRSHGRLARPLLSRQTCSSGPSGTARSALESPPSWKSSRSASRRQAGQKAMGRRPPPSITPCK